MAKEPLPENTYDIHMTFRVTLPGNETPATQDPALLITGEEYNPWPGVHIHDADIISFTKTPQA